MSDPLGGFGPSDEQSEHESLAESFRHRTRAANARGFVGGFPNFYYAATPNDGLLGGAILVNAPGALWQDVPLSDLSSPSLNDFGLRMRATQDYASRAGFVGGFPTFSHADYGNGIVCGTTLLTAEVAEWQDVSLADLGNPKLDDVRARFRGTQDYAGRKGFVGGFPNMYDAVTVCGTILLRAPLAQWQDLLVVKPPG
jgi:hypothetical protein